MGRRVQKNTGVLVCMGRSRNRGLGIIISKTEKPPSEMTYEEKCATKPKPLNLDFLASDAKEVCALVHWLKKPSEWEAVESASVRTWVPLSWLRIVKKEKEEQ